MEENQPLGLFDEFQGIDPDKGKIVALGQCERFLEVKKIDTEVKIFSRRRG